MGRIKIGLCLKSLQLPFRRALAAASKLGVAGVEIDAVGDFAPQALSQTGRRELRHLLRSHDLELTALGCPLRRSLDLAENQQQRLDAVREAIGLSFDLGPRLAVAPVGRLPEKDDDPRAPRLREALAALAGHGDRIGATLALETGPDAGATLKRYLDTFDSGSLGASFNPAGLLGAGHDPRQSARDLAQRVVYVHATDARFSSAGTGTRAVPLGHGDIDWMALVATFEEIGYHGWLVVDGEAEAAASVEFLRRLTGAA
jgi:sugar phosphate isomerase/epimerase